MLGKMLFQISEVDEEEWATAWKKYYHPVKFLNVLRLCRLGKNINL